jgi:MFS family permease
MALWSGHTISSLGSSIAMIAYPLLALLATGSAFAAGVIAFVGMAAGAILRLPAGVLVDRLPRRLLLVACDAMRAVTTASVALAVVVDRLSMTHLVIVAVVNSGCDALFDPAQWWLSGRSCPRRSYRTPWRRTRLAVTWRPSEARLWGASSSGLRPPCRSRLKPRAS